MKLISKFQYSGIYSAAVLVVAADLLGYSKKTTVYFMLPMTLLWLLLSIVHYNYVKDDDYKVDTTKRTIFEVSITLISSISIVLYYVKDAPIPIYGLIVVYTILMILDIVSSYKQIAKIKANINPNEFAEKLEVMKIIAKAREEENKRGE